MLSRRDFLKSSTLVALAPTVPAFLAQTARAAKPQKDSRVLVVIQLDGGNDGINTVVPFKDPGYAKHRKTLRLRPEQLVKVSDTVGLHPSLKEAGALLESGRLAIVQGVSYPNPNRSHFHSMAIWQTARLEGRRSDQYDQYDADDLGWLGRALDAGRPRAGEPASVFVGAGRLPRALVGRRAIASSLTDPKDFLLAPEAKPAMPGTRAAPKDGLAWFLRRNAVDAYATADRMAAVFQAKDDGPPYPTTELAGHLRLMARMIKANVGPRVYYARQDGYDTHAAQASAHADLLGELSGALKAFQDDLAAAKVAERVVVMTFSEFGRTVRENGSQGTDHGTAGPMFLAGPGVKAGLVGANPSLLDLDKDGELKVSVDFRRVYAAVLQDWLGLPAKGALGGDFEPLPLFRN